MRQVLRLRPGTVVEAVDGAGRLYRVRLTALAPAGARGAVLAEGPARGESPCRITLAQAVLKGERMAWLVQKATELGVARIVPVATARVVARPSERGVARWERVAREAVKQCGRAVVPRVEPVWPLEAVLAEAERYALTWLCWEGGGMPVGQAAHTAGRPAEVLVLVGPEGGFATEEVRRACAAGAVPVSLGPRVLRAESAALAALTLCQHLFGDLGAAEPAAGGDAS